MARAVVSSSLLIFSLLSTLDTVNGQVHSLRGAADAGYTFDEHIGDDLGIRFSKFHYLDPANPPQGAHRPMTVDDYPITLETALWLRQTTAISVVVEDDCQQNECNIDLETLLQSVGGLPPRPSSNPNHVFWGEFCEVVIAQQKRLAGVDPTEVMPLPAIWNGYSIHDVAEAVHDEYPGLHHVTLITHLLNEGAEIDRTIVPSGCVNEFLRGAVMLAEVNTWTIGTVGPHNFQTKWAGGQARPEEIAYLIKTGGIAREHVPTVVWDALQPMYMGFEGRNFTAYPEGSPTHPSWPAMHSAASAGSMWMPVVMDLTPEQVCHVKAVDYAVSYARTVAGVHYPSDNIVGLQLGQEIIARKLPRYLANQYGGDIRDIRAKVGQFRFDWSDYLNDPVCFPPSSST